MRIQKTTFFLKVNYIKALSTFLFVLLFSFSQAQLITESVYHVNYTIKDGLPSLETYDVFHDSKGLTWIGTDNGLVKYDGKKFTTYTTKDGLTDNTIFRIQEDDEGRIWFLTYNRQLCYLEEGNFTPFKFNSQIKAATQGLFIGHHFTHINFTPENGYELITANLLSFQIDSSGKVQSNYPINTRPEFRELRPLRSLEDAIYFLKKEKLFKRGKYLLNFAALPIRHIFLSEKNSFVGTENGLLTVKDESFEIQTVLSGYFVTGYSVDFEGGLWCSTLYNGLIYIPSIEIKGYNIPHKKTKHIHAILPQMNSLYFCYDKSNFLLKYTDQGLLQVDQPIDFELIPDSISNHGIKLENSLYFKDLYVSATSAIKTDEKILFTCDKRGLTYLEKTESELFKKLVQKHPLSSFTSKYDSNKENWLFAPNFKYYKKVSDKAILNRMPHAFVQKVFRVSRKDSNNLLFATQVGVLQYNIETEEFIPNESFNFLNKSRVQDLLHLPDSTIVFATKANGIFIYKNNQYTQLFSGNQEQITFYQLLHDNVKNCILASSNRGIISISNDDSNWNHRVLIDNFDGINTSDIRQMFLTKDKLFFANSHGVSEMMRLDLYKQIPRPIIHSISSNFDSTSSIPFEKSSISIQVNPISYKSAEKMQIAYRLLPANENWKYSNNFEITYNSLRPEKYTLEIKAINLEGTESEIHSIEFEVAPPYWMTWWFRLFLIITITFLVYLITQKAIQFYKGQARLQQNLKELQIMSMQAKMNPHFIFNSLNSIQNYILKNEREKANDYLLEFSKLVRIILQNSDNTSITLKDELNTLRLYVDLEKRRLRKDLKYTVIIEPEVNSEMCQIPTLLIQPYIENAIWHGKVYQNPKGEIKIEVKKNNSRLHISIMDNGIGIKNAQKSKVNKSKHKSLGAKITRSRIELLSELNSELSNISITELNPESDMFVGTLVSFYIPYQLKK